MLLLAKRVTSYLLSYQDCHHPPAAARLLYRNQRISQHVPENREPSSDPVTTRRDKHACGKPMLTDPDNRACWKPMSEKPLARYARPKRTRKVQCKEYHQITRSPCRRRQTRSIPRAEKFGDLITADHKILNEEGESRHAVVEQDLATQWIQSYPVQNQNFERDGEKLTQVS